MSKFKVDVVAFFAKVQAPDELSDAYTLNAVAHTPEAEKVFKDLGAEPAVRRDGTPVEHEGYEGKPVFKIKRKVRTKSGESLGPPGVYDSQGNPLECLIGNGSIVRVYGSAFHWNFKGKQGVGLGLNSVQVIKLVEYGDSGVDKIDGGFVSSTEVPDSKAANDEVF